MVVASYSLAEVLTAANSHPFYVEDRLYPADSKSICKLRESILFQKQEHDLERQPLLDKKKLYKIIQRLTHDMSPKNTYRHGSYMSITGGGSGAVPMMFAVDVHENRRQRAQMGNFLKLCGVIKPEDLVLSTHLAGGFYRSLDLTTETMENAGATVLSAGSYMLPAEVAKALANYHVNVLTGDGSQIVQIVHHVSMITKENRERIILNKIIYTSEPLTGPQRAFIKKILGDIKIFSIMGSAEAGSWAISNPDLTGEQSITDKSTDFIFDTRNVMLEIISSATINNTSLYNPHTLPEGETGVIVQTSLQRLRNPLIRYVTGDIGSIHPLPLVASTMIHESDRKFLRVLRMQGRDHRFSFKWYGAYFEFQKIEQFMQEEEYGILQWQIVLDRMEDTPQSTLEIRLLRSPPQEGILSAETFTERLEAFFLVFPENKHLVRIVFLVSLDGFERSVTAGKVIKFVNRWD